MHIGKIGDVFGLNLAKVLINQFNNLVRIKITRHGYTVVVWHIKGIKMLVNVCQRRVLQMLNSTDGSLGTIRMVREQSLIEFLIGGTGVVGHIHILLLINGLQLSVEQAEDGIGKSLALNFQPTFNLIAWNILLVNSHII